MRIFATFNEDGSPSGFFPDIYDDGSRPEGSVEIAQSQWESLSSNADLLFIGGSIVEKNIPTTNPLTLPITKRQMLGVLADMGIDAEPIIDGAIEAIEHTQTRAQYRNDWRYAGGFVRQHPLFNDPAFMALLGMTSEQIDTLWVAAQDYPA